MVAAGVYLVGRFFPVFPPEALLVIAIIGAITLLLAATIAITATDIKRVLAYSTVSQLGYMMLALGIGGWAAGMFHLITHAFFKSLLFMCSGSVIHACHTNEMPKMGGLRKKMPITAYTMLVGCLAIAGAGLPFAIGGVSIGLSGYYSKDAIIAQAMSFKEVSPVYGWLFYIASIGAAITAFYMFRLWYMTFAGQPRDYHIYDHAHESPPVMTYPLIALAVMAIIVGWPILGLTDLLEQARPLGTSLGSGGRLLTDLHYVDEHVSHTFHTPATWVAFSTAASGFLLATVFYLWRVLDPAEVALQFKPIYKLLVHKWYFDELYNAICVQPVLFVARRISDLDRKVLDWLIDHTAIWMRKLALVDDWMDRQIVDGLVNWFARWTYALGQTLRMAQTGMVRQYVLFIVVATVGLFVLITYATAGGW
jgi:NADH-quinone oxidoreductase subunit L